MDDNNQQPGQGMPCDNLAPPKADFSAPPPYELTNSNGSSNINLQGVQRLSNNSLQQQQHNQSSIIQNFGKLPTYEEVQMEKTINGEFMQPYMHMPTHMNTPPPPNPLLANINRGDGVSQTPSTRALTFIAIDAANGENLSSNDNNLLGTDIMFITAFIVAFLFNWIGFLMLTCFCHTIAARYGALSGFGLSLAKWTLIFKHSTELVSHENSWLWWLIMAFGFLICIRALIQYVSIKRTWRLLSTSAQERLLFFY